MKIKQEQLDRLARTLMGAYRTNDLITTNRPESEIQGRIVDIVKQNFAEEEIIEEEARQMLSTYSQATKNMDPYKMFLLAKQKLAAKKGFIL